MECRAIGIQWSGNGYALVTWTGLLQASDELLEKNAFGARFEREGVVVLQLRRYGKGSSARSDVRGSRNREDRTLTQLVMAAADIGRDRPAVVGQGYAVNFGELKGRAQGAAIAMASEAVDDSALTVALMTSVPGLAVSGPRGLADTLAGIRIQAMMVLAEAELV